MKIIQKNSSKKQQGIIVISLNLPISSTISFGSLASVFVNSTRDIELTGAAIGLTSRDRSRSVGISDCFYLASSNIFAR